MSSRLLYSIAGLVVATAANLVGNWLAAALQQRTFANQFSTTAIWILVVSAILCVVIGAWLGTKINIPAPATNQPPTSRNTSPIPQGVGKQRQTKASAVEAVTITRLAALFSYYRLKGKGIQLSDIISFGSVVRVEADDQGSK